MLLVCLLFSSQWECNDSSEFETDKTFRLYKSSTLGFSRSNQALDVSGSTEPEGDSRFDTSLSGKASSQWDDEMGRECKRIVFPLHLSQHLLITCLTTVSAKSSLPILGQVAQTEKVAAENQLDRMSLWIKSVESKSFHPHQVIRIR